MHQANSAAAARPSQTNATTESDPPSQDSAKPAAPLWTGLYLREQRTRWHLTQRELARKIGCAHATVGHWEQGRRRIPHTLSARLLAIFEAEARDEANHRARLIALHVPLRPGDA